MSTRELMDMPVSELADENAVLFMWATSPMLPDALQVLEAWGFVYKSSFVWDKVRHNFGHYNSVRHELLLIGTRGSCLPDSGRLFDSVVAVDKTSIHSQKPPIFREMIDELYTWGPRIELFLRGDAPDGWAGWGNEAA
jgi:N6-adenosine-specific RNA methylase IME4